MSAALALVREYVDEHADEVARRLEGREAAEVAALVAALPHRTAALLLRRMVPSQGSAALQAMAVDAAGEVLEALPSEIAAGLLRRADPAGREALLAVMARDRAQAVARLLSYDAGSAGSVMDPHPPVVPAGVDVAAAREQLWRQSVLGATAYVVDADHRLVGILDLADLMQAAPDTAIRSLMSDRLTWLLAGTTLESVFDHPGWRDHDSLPVVDNGHRLLGVLRHVRVRQLEAERETGADPSGGLDTVIALGELYWVGLSGLLQGFAAAAEAPARERR